ncbi:glycosyltransferase family 4 protein [Pseudanabaena sp. FACHB-1998]|uniref:glycosyltransferase family 4 protein n=1 Tax=Pseudanabaena sp. FACHB-1998 TaxID=2692858 RepID=UPI0016801C67|nr:glycosyltransferase family 4 protein [Pseudanabaena sp. FACHB-1998]MBD2177247.1 glycosyltransferase family 4 protein [Pseudanabaena sp. FACHB-1998]
MKLLLTSHQFLPEHSSGTEILTFQVAKELKNRGHEVTVFTGHPTKTEMPESDRFESYVYKGIKVLRFHHSYVPLGGQKNMVEAEYNNIFFANYFRKYLKEFNPDIVHFFHLSKLSASAIDVCVSLKIPRIMTTTDFWLVCPTNQLRLPDGNLCNGPDINSINCVRHIVQISQSPNTHAKLNLLPNWLVVFLIWIIKSKLLYKLWFTEYVLALVKRQQFLKIRMNNLDRVLVPTRLMQNILQNNGLNPNLISYMPYGLDIEDIIPNSNKGLNKELRVGFIGTLFEHKGVHLLIESTKLLSNINFELKIYGNLGDFPEYVAKLYKIASNDPRINFCGTFPNPEIGKILSEIDVLVVPSIWYENTPLVIYSAQAAGCPVIATNLGGMSEVVQHEINGLLFEKGNIRELANCIRKLDEDREFLKQLANNSVSPKSMQEYVHELESIYENLLNQHN